MEGDGIGEVGMEMLMTVRLFVPRSAPIIVACKRKLRGPIPPPSGASPLVEIFSFSSWELGCCKKDAVRVDTGRLSIQHIGGK